jgi:hypothetical protein
MTLYAHINFFLVSYITAIFPYLMIIILIIRGATLEGAIIGIRYYILDINTEKLSELQVKLFQVKNY